MYKLLFVVLLFVLLMPACFTLVSGMMRRADRMMASDRETAEQVAARVRAKKAEIERDREEIEALKADNRRQNDILRKLNR